MPLSRSRSVAQSTAFDADDSGSITDVTGVVPIQIHEDTTARIVPALRLVCVAGEDLGRTFSLTSLPTVIGRGVADVALKANDVSRSHARLMSRGSTFYIEELGSANGTFVNGVAVEGSAIVKIGDRIQLGTTILVFTHHDELEDRMHQLKRLEAMGAMAGGLAHDFNNALVVIMGNLDIFERRLSSNPELHDMVNDMRAAASSASSLARRLLRLGHSEPLEFSQVSLAPVVQRTTGMIRRQLGGRIDIKVNVPSDLAVRGSLEELHQVLLNLMLNARDAMPHGGTIRLNATAVTFDRSQAVTRHLPDEGDYVQLDVTDNGTGMDAATLSRAFDPFFTTKAPGQGTGLGLAMIHSIVRRHGGAVVVDSMVGKGTTFSIWLPRDVSSR